MRELKEVDAPSSDLPDARRERKTLALRDAGIIPPVS
jgi:hypothetical protein